MIITSIIQFCINLLAGVLNIIPSLDFDTSGFTSVTSSIRDVIAPSAFLLPLGDIAAALAVFLAYQAGGFLIWAINWVVRRIADVIP